LVRALVLYGAAPDPERFADHVALCEQVSGATFRHGRVFGAPVGEPAHGYYAEFEWSDREAFERAARSPEFMATGKDALDLALPFSVEFVELD